MNWQRIVKGAILCAIFSIVGGLVISAVSYFVFGASAGHQDAIEHPFLYAFVAVGIAPFVETLLFLAIDVFSKNLRSWIRLGISVAAFSLMHIAGGPIKALLVLWPGLVCAYAYFYIGKTRKESYWTSSIAHSLHNGALLLIPAFA